MKGFVMGCFRCLAVLVLGWGLFVGLPAFAEDPALSDTASQPADAVEEPGLEIIGVVLNHFGGGIDNAEVRIESLDAPADAEPLATTRTNQMGDIEITLKLPAPETVRVRIRSEGQTEWIGELDLTDEFEDPFIDATLVGSAKIEGRVVAAADESPIAGAHVACTNAGRELNVQTDESGEFVLDGISRGQAALRIRAEGFAIANHPVDVQDDTATAHVMLHPERVILFTVVTDDGTAAAGVTIEAVVNPGHEFLTTLSDAEGKAKLGGVRADAEAMELRLNGPGYVQMNDFGETLQIPPVTTQPADGKPSLFEQRLVVTLAAGLRGKIVDAETGEPVPSARLLAGAEVLYSMPMAFSTLNGEYELLGLPPGKNIITIQQSDHATDIRELTLTAGEISELNVRLKSGNGVGGVVVDDQGKPMGQVRVSAEEWNGFKTIGMRTITDDEGRFLFEHAPAGEIAFRFVHPGQGAMADEVLQTGKTDHQVTLKPPPAVAAPGAGPMAQAPGGFKVGDQVPELVMTGTDGRVYKLSELRGKFVFLDCWASWCGPCLAEIPNIQSLHQVTRNRTDFLLLGVSLDQDRKAFKNALEIHKMTWPQVFGPESGAEQVFRTLDGRGIPYTCLIGPDGVMLEQHLRGKKVVSEVMKHLHVN